MTKPTQDKETLREAVARAIYECDIEKASYVIGWWQFRPDTKQIYLQLADAAIATMFERLRTPSEGMIATAGWHLPEQTDDESVAAVWQAMLDKCKQENSDA
jgi:hypothetical protein